VTPTLKIKHYNQFIDFLRKQSSRTMLQHQSSELRRLEQVLSAASSREDRNTQAGHILLESMNLEVFPKNLHQFYGLLNKATSEAKSLQRNPEIDEDIEALNELNQLFVLYHVWTEPWITFRTQIEGKYIRSVIRSLANRFNIENPSIFSEQDFLEELKTKFSALSVEITDSELSTDLKNFLKQQIGEILTEIYRYDTHGKKGLEKTAKSMIASLSLSESILDEKDKNNPSYRKAVSTVLALIMNFGSFAIQIAPDYDDFWRPSVEHFLDRYNDFSTAISEGESIKEILEKASLSPTETAQERLSGSSVMYLTAGAVGEENLRDAEDKNLQDITSIEVDIDAID
jgi:hypothetical protein